MVSRSDALRDQYCRSHDTQRVTPAASFFAALLVTIQDIGGGKTRMSIASEFPTVEAVEQHAAMAMEGLTQAVGQIDAILAAPKPATRGADDETP